MISCRLCVLLAVIFYSKSVMSCYDDNDCYGSDVCCSSGCRSSCSTRTDGATVAIIVVVCICAAFAKVAFWVCYWYFRCRRRVPHSGIVIQRSYHHVPQTVVLSTTTTSQGYTRLTQEGASAEHAYPNRGYDSPPGTTLTQGGVISNPAPTAPPPYTEVVQS